MSKLVKAFAPASVAILGASDNPHKAGGRPIAFLKRYGFAGRIYPVNPARAQVQGLRAYAALAALPEVPELVIVAVGGAAGLAMVEACAAAGVPVVHPIVEQEGDQLAACIAAARAHGVQVHVWKVCWEVGWQGARDAHEPFEREGRLQVDRFGRTRRALCPSNPVNRRYELDAILEAAEYDVDGIHLDYIRYPDASACYCAGCRRRFSQWLAKPIRAWPDDVRAGAWRGAYTAWRRDQITTFVRAVRNAARAANPALRVSAAVYPLHPDCADSIGQDWALWLKEDLVDFVCPMNYESRAGALGALVARQLALPDTAGRLYPGLGVTAMDSQLSADQTIEQIRRVRAAGAGGFVLFDLNRTLEHDVLPMLKLGATRP